MERAQGEAGSGRQAGDAGSEAAESRRHDETALAERNRMRADARGLAHKH